MLELKENGELASPGAWVAPWRVGLGILQGVCLYWLYTAGQAKTTFATTSEWFSALVLLALFLPTLTIISLGHLSRKTFIAWIGVLLASLAGLAYYEQWRLMGALSLNGWGEAGADSVKYPSVLLGIFTAVVCFIAHALLSAAHFERKRIASYNAYFDAAWKLWVQLKFSYVFLGAFWLILYLGANLFLLIKVDFLHKAIQEAWFVIPVCLTALSFALHLTDVRPAIVNSIRNLLLVLLSWILPVAVLIIGGFLLTLPFTGLANLWATKRATAILLCAVAALIVLINTAFQNGAVAKQVPKLLRLAASGASALLLPLTVIAAYALGLRVNEYGWTTDRIIAACCVVVASGYALGYLWALATSTPWLANIAKVNIAGAFLVIGVIVSLFSPLLDPARLSVNHQLHRFESGAVSAANFDYAYLKFEGKRFGAAALNRLAADKNHPQANEIAKKIELVMVQKNNYDKNPQLAPTIVELTANLTAYPNGTVLPQSFLKQEWKGKTNSWELPDCFFKRESKCDVIALDINGDSVNELLVIDNKPHSSRGSVFQQKPDGSWFNLGSLTENPRLCDAQVAMLKRGEFGLKTPLNKDLELGGKRYAIRDPYAQTDNCP